jgi:hypothetical protein
MLILLLRKYSIYVRRLGFHINRMNEESNFLATGVITVTSAYTNEIRKLNQSVVSKETSNNGYFSFRMGAEKCHLILKHRCCTPCSSFTRPEDMITGTGLRDDFPD